MDWIRRNWPDLLIGIALVAVIAGIIATLLTGGSFFPLGQSDGVSSRPQSSTTGTSRARPLAGAAEAGSTAGDTSSRGGEAVAGAGDVERIAPRSGVEVTALPIPGAMPANSVGATNTGAGPREDAGRPETASSSSVESTATSPTTSTAMSTPASTPASEGAGERPGATTTAASTISSAGSEEGLYRISVGAFSSQENAERQAAIFREAGYPVFIGQQGDLSIVLVGPYDQQGEAERIAARIRAGDFRIEPVVYRFRAEEGGERASSGQQQAAPPAVAPTPASVPAPQATASGASGARYLQVGAYATSASARPQRDRLEGLGFRVTERTEGTLLKLLVGPFAGDDLAAARSRLNEQGIEHFPR